MFLHLRRRCAISPKARPTECPRNLQWRQPERRFEEPPRPGLQSHQKTLPSCRQLNVHFAATSKSSCDLVRRPVRVRALALFPQDCAQLAKSLQILLARKQKSIWRATRVLQRPSYEHSSQRRAKTLDEQEIGDFLNELVDARLMYREGNRFLSLAIAANGASLVAEPAKVAQTKECLVTLQ